MRPLPAALVRLSSPLLPPPASAPRAPRLVNGEHTRAHEADFALALERVLRLDVELDVLEADGRTQLVAVGRCVTLRAREGIGDKGDRTSSECSHCEAAPPS